MASPLYSGARILENATAILNSSLATLEAATEDTSRMNKILRTEKVFGLVPEKDVELAKESMEAEAHPQIQYLLSKIEKEVTKLRRKISLLQSKQRLQKVQQDSASHIQRPSHSPDPFKIGRLKFLQQKKKRLEQVLADRKQALGHEIHHGLPKTPSLPFRY